MRTKSRCMHGDEGALDGGGEDHVRDEQEPAQTSAPVSTTTAALAGSEDNSSPHWISDYTGRDGPFRSLSPSARGLPSPLETARALIAASDRKEALTGRRVMRRAGEKGGATQEGERRREKVRFDWRIFRKKKKNWTAG